MKTTHITFLSIVTIFTLSSCEDFLDKSPDLGLDESAIYESYEAARGFLDTCYPLLSRWNERVTDAQSRDCNYSNLADEAGYSIEGGWNSIAGILNQGNWYTTERNHLFEIGTESNAEGGSNGNGYKNYGAPIIYKSYRGLRIANRMINGIDKVQNVTEGQKNELLGQAYFYRAWFYYQLINRYGGMPILDKVFNGGDDNVVRKTYRESFEWMLSDIEKAIELLPPYWDDSNWGRPDKAAALGFKAQATLYAASPLMQNDLKETVNKGYDRALCLKAAMAAQNCLDFIEQNPLSCRKMTKASSPDMIEGTYKGIFVISNTDYFQEEYLWWNATKMATTKIGNTLRTFWIWVDLDINNDCDGQGFACPTGNIADMYERKGDDGLYYPISDPRSGFKPVELDNNLSVGPWSNMKNRDPRMYYTLLFPGQRWGNKDGVPYYISSWEGGSGSNSFKSGNLSSQRSFTGWLNHKYSWPEATHYYTVAHNNTGFALYSYLSFYIRVTEMYLDYAEALFEATEDANTAPEGFKMTAVEALNVVRERVGVTPVVPDFTTADKFRETYRRERTVEMMFEGMHRWEDVRRWMIFDEVFKTSMPIYNMVWTCDQGENVKPSEYNDGKDLTFSYVLQKNLSEVRNYSLKHYWYPFTGSELGSLDKLVQNPGW